MFKRTILIISVALSLTVLITTTFAQSRKLGLFVGINDYQDGINKLPSCVNDATKMQSKLSRNYGFEASNLSLLTDSEATRENILSKLAFYEKETSKGDLFVFFYSGHGSVFPDAYSPDFDETEQVGMQGVFPSGYYDSALVPVDARQTTGGKPWKNLILDDELNIIFQRFTTKGVQVVFISDSCHSGTLAKSLNSDSTQATKFVSPKLLNFDTENWQKSANRKGNSTDKDFSNLFLVIGSSQDDQFSSGANPETGRSMSMFTYAFLKTLEQYESTGKVFTYKTIQDIVNPLVNNWSNQEQTPRIDVRFFDSALLNTPVFSLLSQNSSSQGGNLRIVVKVTDENGSSISDAVFGVFPIGKSIGKGEIRKSDVLMLGRTNAKGLFDSSLQTLPIGAYQIKVVKQGYNAYIKEMSLTESKNGIAVFVFKLIRE